MLSANITSATLLAIAGNHISAGIASTPVTSEGISGVGRMAPREKLSKEYTATMNIQQVSTNGDVEAGTL